MAALLIVSGGFVLVAARDLTLRATGLALTLGGLSLYRESRRSIGLPLPSRRLWISGLVSAVLTFASFEVLSWDAQTGYQQVWPVYAFALLALACTGIWSAIVARTVG